MPNSIMTGEDRVSKSKRFFFVSFNLPETMPNETTPILSKVQNKKSFIEKPSKDISVKTCVICILLYLASAVLFYTFIFQPDWSFIDSLYFAVGMFLLDTFVPLNNMEMIQL